MFLTVRVAPSSSKNEVVGWMSNGVLKIKIAAPPVDGKANTELVAFLSKILKLPKTEIEITNGLTSKKKTVRLPLDQETLVKILAVDLSIQEPAIQPKMF
jgi:hypothetical protein